MKKILFYPSGDRELPSSHLRVYEVAKELEAMGHSVTVVRPDLSDDNKRVYLELAEPGSIVYVQKIGQAFHKPENFLPYKNKYTIVYDVDDFHDGLDDQMIELADLVIAGSHYVADHCKKYNENVRILCSITDTSVYQYVNRSDKPESPVTIVWTESFANAYLEDLSLVKAPMRKMHEKHDIRFVLQGLRENRHIPNTRYHNLLVRFIQMFPYAAIQKFMPIDQYLEEGVETLKGADIGVIPFKSDRVGKAGQNMRSLMATGLGVIGTPGNEHEYIIEHGKTGFLASTEAEWEQALETLIVNRGTRLEMGLSASKSIRARYSRKRYMDQITEFLGL